MMINGAIKRIRLGVPGVGNWANDWHPPVFAVLSRDEIVARHTRGAQTLRTGLLTLFL
jgi:hypothetical protein